MTENALSILSVIFSVQLQQTEISERKLFIFHLGCLVSHAMIGIAASAMPEWGLNFILSGDWSNSVPRRQFLKGTEHIQRF